MASSDRGYTILLSHLHNATSSLPLSTVQSALAHHLATISPLPTPLAATAMTSPFYITQPFTYEKLQSFSTTFRHATHLKYRALADTAKTRSRLRTFVGRNMQSVIGQWVTDVLEGFRGGHPVLRISACSGLLLGVEDLRLGERSEKKEGIDIGGSTRSAVEDENVIALAEVMDTYAHSFNSGVSSTGIEEWEKEFQPAGQDILSLVLILGSQSLPLVAQYKLKALPLQNLVRLLTSTISSTFKSGTFLSSVSASVTLSPQHQVHISSSSPLAQTLQSMSSSPLASSIASVSRLTANVLSLLIDEPSSSRSQNGMLTISGTLDVLRELTKQLERDWISCPLASSTDLDIASDSKELTQSIWTTLKTLLFSTIMVAEAVLSTSVYLPPQSTRFVTPASLALQVLHILSHLSFVISQFGGVTTTTQGFEHLKKTFYLALDILAQGDGQSGDAGLKAEAFVQQACFALNSQRAETAAALPRQAKQAFVLASIEQLVPVLSDKCIRDWVWGVCYPHLYDASHRETYESAHSVVLVIFASHAQKQHQQFIGNHDSELPEPTSLKNSTVTNSSGKQWSKNVLNDRHCASRIIAGVIKSEHDTPNASSEEETARQTATNEESTVSETFVKRMVPFYAKCLIDNSVDGKLNTSQLRLAFSALVRSSSASAFTLTGPPDDTYTLAWYCVQTILDIIHKLSPASASQGGKGKGKARDGEKTTDRLQRLRLMLISSVSSLPLPLMLRALDEIRLLIMSYPQELDDSGVSTSASDEKRPKGKAELLDALFDELLEKTGDREKEAGMRWWYKYRSMLVLAETREEARQGTPSTWFEDRKDSGLERKDGAGEESPTDPTLARL